MDPSVESSDLRIGDAAVQTQLEREAVAAPFDAAEKDRHLEVFMEQMLPGRWAMLRPVKPKELKATAVLSMPIEEASAKISAGMPTDADDDLSWPVWAGVIPVALATGAPVADPRNHPDIEMPDHVRRYRFGAADRS